MDLTPYVPRLVLDWGRSFPGVPAREIEGTLVFADVSGFTAMSERLARFGKIGAEEVTSAIDRVFAEMLEVAYAAGGGLLKFGGDAILLLFEGDEHPARGATAAYGMRAAIRQAGRLTTTAGRVTLRMSTGVHSGVFDMALVGERHLELLVLGPDVTQTVAMEAAATAGEIVVSAATAAPLSRHDVGAQRGGGFLLKRAPALDRPAAAAIDRPEGLAAPFIPVAIRRHLQEGGDAPEHRSTTIGFIHVAGTDAVRGPERDAIVAGLREVVDVTNEAADDHGVAVLGSDVASDGVKLILAAGAPMAVADHDERMLLTVRAVVDRVAELPVRAGVHRGHVLAGPVGPFYRRTYTVMGDAVNTAARAMALADVAAVVATPDVVARSSIAFESEPLAPVVVKGKRQPLVVHRVGRPIGSTQGAASNVPLVGREEELAALRAATDATASGSGVAVEVTAEGGVGKTRMMTELCQSTSVPTYVARGDAYASTTPFHPWKQLLEGLLELPPERERRAAALEERVARLDATLLPWLPLVSAVVDVDVALTPEVARLDDRFRAARLHDTVARLLSQLFPRPSLLWFDDAHMMDEPSIELLRSISGRAEELGWLIVVTGRHAVLPASMPARRIELGPLSPDDASRLAKEAAAGELVASEIERLAARASGHPMFILELVRGAVAGAEDDDVSATVEESIAARIDRLLALDRQLLRQLAVLGAPRVDHLDQLVDGVDIDPGTWRRLDGFVEIVDGVVAFQQQLLRDVAYDGLPFSLRRRIHARAGLLLEARAEDPADEADALSLHFHNAGDHERSWRYSRLAAERAWKRHAHLPAARLLRRALASAAALDSLPPAEVARAWQELGEASRLGGAIDEAMRAYAQARRHTDSPVALAHLHALEAGARQVTGRFGPALRWARRGSRVLEAAPDGGQATITLRDGTTIRPALRLLAAEGLARYSQRRMNQAERIVRRGLAEAEASNDLGAIALLSNLLFLVLRADRSPEAAAAAQHAFDAAQQLDNVMLQGNVLNSLAMERHERGAWDDAVELYGRTRDLQAQAGSDVGSAIVANNLAEILSDQGHLADAIAAFEDAARTVRAAGVRPVELGVVLNLARALTRAGRTNEARGHLERADALVKQLDTHEPALGLRTAEVLLAEGEPAAALSVLDRSAAVAGGSLTADQAATAALLRARALAELGAITDATDVLTEGIDGARAAGLRFELACLLEELAALDPERRTERAEAEALLGDLGVVTRRWAARLSPSA